jgi:hypothetical protein
LVVVPPASSLASAKPIWVERTRMASTTRKSFPATKAAHALHCTCRLHRWKYVSSIGLSNEMLTDFVSGVQRRSAMTTMIAKPIEIRSIGMSGATIAEASSPLR